MMMGPEHKCQACNKENIETFWAVRQELFMCALCQRLHNPPHMTLIKFPNGTFSKLWNLEIGGYEDFSEVSEIEICGWFMRSRQESLFSFVPKFIATVYHMEYFGEAACGRCVNYPYFESGDHCLAMACKRFARPFRDPEDIQYPPVRSRYTTWLGIDQ
jgi:hypothetical protein